MADPKNPTPPIDFRPAQAAIKSQHLDLRLDGTLTDTYSLVTLPPTSKLDTACWHYEPKGPSGPARHVITFGPKLAEHLKQGDLGDYAQSYHRHELAHSLWTERDLKGVQEEVKKLDVPFSMLNVFEDARIEAKWRETFPDDCFYWESFEGARNDPQASDDLPKRAMDGLMALIQNEMQVDVMETRLKDLPEIERKEIKAFYDRICEAKTTQDLYPIMGEWKDKFGVPKEEDMPNGSGKGVGSDMAAGAKIQTDPSAHEELIRAESGESEEQDDPDSHNSPAVGAKGTIKGRAKGVLEPRPVDVIDPDRVRMLADILRTVFRERERKTYRVTPSKRISVRHVLAKRERIYRSIEKDAPGMADMVFMIDCSGSMGGGPANSARHIAAALGQLAREGRVAGDMILTKGDGHGINKSEVIALRQVDDKIAARIPSNGSHEAIDETMKANRGRFLGRSLVICFTDGNITDAPIKRSSWHAMGVFSVGAYVGPEGNAPRIRDWFDAPLVRHSETALAIALRDMVGRHLRSVQQVTDSEATRETAAVAPPGVKPARRAVGV